MKKIKKRGAIYGVITMLLCLAIYLNWSYVGAPDDLLAAQNGTTVLGTLEDGTATAVDAETDNASTTAASSDFFSTSRLSREQARDEAISILKNTAESEAADATAREDASAQITVLAENSVTEARVENLIRAKGYSDVVVMIGNDSINVVVQAPEEGLQVSDIAVMKDVILQETEMTADQIKIVEAA